jgi:hypothetical protein
VVDNQLIFGRFDDLLYCDRWFCADSGREPRRDHDDHELLAATQRPRSARTVNDAATGLGFGLLELAAWREALAVTTFHPPFRADQTREILWLARVSANAVDA